jgi:hypothetical protein
MHRLNRGCARWKFQPERMLKQKRRQLQAVDDSRGGAILSINPILNGAGDFVLALDFLRDRKNARRRRFQLEGRINSFIPYQPLDSVSWPGSALRFLTRRTTAPAAKSRTPSEMRKNATSQRMRISREAVPGRFQRLEAAIAANR